MSQISAIQKLKKTEKVIYLIKLEMFKVNLMIRYLPYFIIKLDLTRLLKCIYNYVKTKMDIKLNFKSFHKI